MQNTSFKDPSGFVFIENDSIYRQINKVYKNDYDLLMSSGLYQELTDKGYLVPHQELELDKNTDEKFYKFIQPEKINFISYAYEWSFSQLKDSAILTLEIQKLALKYGMSLKDATNFNVQFKKGKPIFIDTLSFEQYKKDTPWQAYKQFCQHFLAPLALMSYTDIRLNQLLKNNIDGIPLDLTCKLLPGKSKFNFGLLAHIFMHSGAQKQYENEALNSKENIIKLSLFALNSMIDSLLDCVKALKLPNIDTEWGEYYLNTNYSDEAFLSKKEIIEKYIEIIKPETVWDLGANKGDFSRIASDKGIDTISFDIDPIAVEKNYQDCKKNKETNILPLISDLTNPTPDVGFMNDERASFMKRANADLTLALALIHHLAISNNLPFDNIANFFSTVSPYLVIEFVPKEDSKVQKLLASREDIFDNYNESQFEISFSKYYEIIAKQQVKESNRTIYLMKGK